jgi:hypothetical protein
VPSVTRPESGFCRAGLSDLLLGFADVGYESVVFDEVDPDRPHLLLRHDVDFDLRHAVAVAEVEHSLGFRSTFFVMVRSECYSILDAQSRADLRRLVELGHRIGLHLDVTLYEADELVDGAEQELRILEWVAGDPVDIISFHRPAQHLVGSERGGLPRRHTYEPAFTEKLQYVSDSQGRFRFGHPFDTDAFADHTAIQLLLHPVWWAGDVPEGPEQRLRGMVADRTHAFAARVARNCTPYRDMIR